MLRLKRRLRLKIFAAGFALLVAGGVTAWMFPEKVLTVDSGPVKADVLVVLGGTPDRAVRAAELFKEGAAPKVLVSGFGDDLSNKHTLVRDGVPAGNIILEGKSRTTQQNAEFSIPLLRKMGARKVIIVTSWYHSRRGLMCFEHYAPDIQFYSRPSYFGYVGRTEDGQRKADNEETGGQNSNAAALKARNKAERKKVRRYTDSEYFKLLGYWVCYGVSPL